MMEFLRFGAAWVSLLFLVGLTTLPPSPQEFSCCLQEVEENDVPYSQWIAKEFHAFTGQVGRILLPETNSTVKPTQCFRTNTGEWVTVTEENQQQINGFFLSRFCDIKEAVHWLFGPENAWSDGGEAVGLMLGEANIGMGMVSSWLGGIVGYCMQLSHGLSLFNVVVYSVDFLTTNLLNCQLPGMSTLANFSLSASLLSVVSATASATEYLTPTVIMVNTAISATLRYLWDCLLSCLNIGSILNATFWAIVTATGSVILGIWGLFSPVFCIDFVAIVVTVTTGIWSFVKTVYNLFDVNQYIAKIAKAIIYGLGNYLFVPTVTGLAEVIAFVTFMVANYLVNPVAAVFIYMLSGILTPYHLRQIALSIAEFTHEVQGLVMFALKGLVVVADNSNEYIQAFSERYPVGLFGDWEREDPADPADPQPGRMVSVPLTDLTLAISLGSVMFLVYKYAPDIQKTIQVLRSMPRVERDPEEEHEVKKYVFKKLIGQNHLAVKLLKSDKNFRCFHVISKHTKSPVFLKCLRTGASKAARISLAKECRATKVLVHPNIVRFATWIRAGYMCALGTEFSPFGNLKLTMASNPTKFSLKDRLGVFKQVLEAVVFLHSMRGAHLNIRPASIVVFSKWGSVKLSGFSHVVKVGSDNMCTEYNLHHVAGPTEAIIRREPYNPFRADSWALGSLLFFIISGDFLHNRSNKPAPAVLLSSLKECDMRHQKIIMRQLTSLLCYDPMLRPLSADVLKTLNDLD